MYIYKNNFNVSRDNILPIPRKVLKHKCNFKRFQWRFPAPPRITIFHRRCREKGRGGVSRVMTGAGSRIRKQV